MRSGKHAREKENKVFRGTWRCTSTPLKRKHRREQDATLLASSGSIPTKEVPKPHVSVRDWRVRRCAIKESNRSFSATPPLETLRILLGVACQEDVFRVEDPFLISIADLSRAHFFAVAVRNV